MQIIIPLDCRPEDYAAQAMHREVQAPERCPNCRKAGKIRAHGYGYRCTSDTQGKVLTIGIRRFRCRRCSTSISCLPSFAQPYHLINNTTIERSFAGDSGTDDVRRHAELLKRYWHRFSRSATSTSAIFHTHAPMTPKGLWTRLMSKYGALDHCTRRLAADRGLTCFGAYRCHRRRAP